MSGLEMCPGRWEIYYKWVRGIAESGGVVDALLMLVGEARR